MSDLLESLIQLAPIFQLGSISDCFIVITDRDKYRAYFPPRAFDIKIKVGAELRKGGVNYTVIHENRKIYSKVGREVHGVPYVAVGIPIVDNGSVVGCLSTGISVDFEERIENLSKDLEDAVHSIVNNAESLAKTSEELAMTVQQVNSSTAEVEKSIRKASEITDFIKNISSQTTLLGLNAAIEAARAGESGRGFSVVAEEIRNLSRTTADSTKNITHQLEEIEQNISSVVTQMNQTSANTMEQSSRLQELSSISMVLEKMVEELRKVTQLMIRMDE